MSRRAEAGRETVIDAFEDTATARPEGLALRHRTPSGWRELTWAEYRREVRLAARALMRLGVGPGSGVVILGGNRPEWLVANLAAMAAGGLPSGIYATSTPEQAAFIVRHSEAVVAVVEDARHLRRLAAVRGQLAAVVAMDGDCGDGVLSWRAFLDLGRSVPEVDLDARTAGLRRNSACVLIYTSGTTGEPKGVLLSHGNVLFIAGAVAAEYRVTDADLGLSYLPLSHIAEQVLSIYIPLLTGARIAFGERLETLPEDLRQVRPTFFFGVPRVWEKIQDRMMAAGASSGPLRRRLVSWAREVGRAAGRAGERGGPAPRGRWLAERLVFQPVRRRLGFDRVRVFLTSAAPMARSTLDFFTSLGIPIFEVCGMSECTGPATFATAERHRFGSVGWTIPGTELRIADDGEILYRGPHVFLGYHHDPAATREALDGDGWLHSGDLGSMDEDGFVWITDRKKELIITSGGKNVAPVAIESLLRGIPGVGQAVVVGDRRKHLVALVAIEPDAVPELATALGSAATSVAEAAACDRFRRYIDERVEAVNASLAPYETIKRVAILDRPLTVENGTLTPTLKLKRRVIQERFGDVIDRLYRAR